jgi:hypothetical protein
MNATATGGGPSPGRRRAPSADLVCQLRTQHNELVILPGADHGLRALHVYYRHRGDRADDGGDHARAHHISDRRWGDAGERRLGEHEIRISNMAVRDEVLRVKDLGR